MSPRTRFYLFGFLPIYLGMLVMGVFVLMVGVGAEGQSVVPYMWERTVVTGAGTDGTTLPGFPDLSSRIAELHSPFTMEGGVLHDSGATFDHSRSFRVQAHYITVGQLTTQTRTFQLEVQEFGQDWRPVEGCRWRIGQSASADRQVAHVTRDCIYSPEPGDWQVRITGTGNTAFIEWAAYSITVVGRDDIMIDNHILEVIEKVGPFLLFMGLFLWASVQRNLIMYGAALMAGIYAMATLWEGLNSIIVVVGLLVGLVLLDAAVTVIDRRGPIED